MQEEPSSGVFLTEEGIDLAGEDDYHEWLGFTTFLTGAMSIC